MTFSVIARRAKRDVAIPVAKKKRVFFDPKGLLASLGVTRIYG
jgi:hypothetical protein